MQEKIVELEKLIAFQEQTISELNSELIEQQKRIVLLEKQMRSLIEHARDEGSPVKDIKDEVPPPHY